MDTRDDDVRRNFDGSIDFDFYRRRAARLRAKAIREFFTARIAPFVKPAIAVAILITALLSMPTGEGLGPDARQPDRHLAVAAEAKDQAVQFRRLAADLLASTGLHGDGDRSSPSD